MKKALLLVWFISSQLILTAQFNEAEFRSFSEEVAKEFDLPSMSMAIVKDGELMYSFNYGLRGRSTDTKPTDQQTLYGIASLSKAFTAAAIGILVDEGKLNWTDHVIDHLPWFALNDPYVTEHMTIEDLLCHRSGLITFDGDLLWYGSNYSREEAVKRIRHRSPSYEFRTEFGYQNLMFMTAGEVIEAVSGMSWDNFIMTRLLEPLNMTMTTSSFERFSAQQNSAKPHLNGEEIFQLSYDNSGATAALNSNAEEMSRWLNFWLNQGVVDGDTLLEPTTVNKIWALHTPLGIGRFDEEHGVHFKGYGLGWFLMDYQGKKVVHHGGGLPGYITKAALVPEENLGVVVLTNDMSSVPSMMMYAVIDAILGEPYQEWNDVFLAFKEKVALREAEQKEARLATKNDDPEMAKLKTYLGTYRDEMYGDARIYEEDGVLLLSFLPAQELFTGPLSPWDNHAFRFDHQDPFLTFGVIQFEMENGNAKGFTVELPNYDFHFDKLNFKRVD